MVNPIDTERNTYFVDLGTSGLLTVTYIVASIKGKGGGRLP